MRTDHANAPAAAPSHLATRGVALAGALLIGMAAQIDPAPAQDLGEQQLARTPEAAEDGSAGLSKGLDLSFDAKAVIGDGDRTAGTGAGTSALNAERSDSQVELHGLHKLEISLYPDDLRPADRRER